MLKKQRLNFDLILLGDPASGKNTQAELLTREFFYKPVESGQYLRRLQKQQTPVGRKLSARLSQGLPAPTAIVKKFLDANLRLVPKDRNLLFIGNPRLLPEAKHLKQLLAKYNRKYIVLYMSLPVKEIYARSEKRRRDADDVDHVKRRIDWHNKQVAKTIKYFHQLKKLKYVDANQTVKQVNAEIRKLLYDYSKS